MLGSGSTAPTDSTGHGSYKYRFTIDPEGPLTGLPTDVQLVRLVVKGPSKPLARTPAERTEPAGVQGGSSRLPPLHFTTTLSPSSSGKVAVGGAMAGGSRSAAMLQPKVRARLPACLPAGADGAL